MSEASDHNRARAETSETHLDHPDPNGLTSIHACIHCPAPEEGVFTGADRIAVKNFLETLAEIAISVASTTDLELNDPG